MAGRGRSRLATPLYPSPKALPYLVVVRGLGNGRRFSVSRSSSHCPSAEIEASPSAAGVTGKSGPMSAMAALIAASSAASPAGIVMERHEVLDAGQSGEG